MKIKKKALLYDLANIAYTIADCEDTERHRLHQVRDICQEGNVDRVARVLGLAYSNVLSLLLPILSPPKLNLKRDHSSCIHDYEICLKDDCKFRHIITIERKLKIKETVYEYMLCFAMADWLAITLPEAADVWKHRFEMAFESLKELVAAIISSSLTGGLRRRLSPFG